MNAQVRLIAATVPLLNALNENRTLFGELMGSPAPDGWPEFPEAIGFALEHLQDAPEPDHAWSMQFFLDAGSDRVIGSGGFVGPPVDCVVEIGYEVAPAFRGLGFGTAAARALVQRAVASGEVDNVIAHTLAGPNASAGVLTSLGFEHVGDQEDPEVGTVWEWRWTRTPVE
jgi:ribosomal-protein-alanine N-acetyltransferase